MEGPLVTPRVPNDPVVYEHTGSSLRPPKGVTYKQVLHLIQPVFQHTPIFKKKELVLKVLLHMRLFHQVTMLGWILGTCSGVNIVLDFGGSGFHSLQPKPQVPWRGVLAGLECHAATITRCYKRFVRPLSPWASSMETGSSKNKESPARTLFTLLRQGVHQF